MFRTPPLHRSEPETDPPHAAVQEEEVWRATEALLQSQQLRASAQCQHLLRYIVEHTLSGDLPLLRERVIGKEVFGRRPDYEPGEDPVVRIRVADLRKRLALYYQALSATPPVKIDVPSGSYRAVFTWASHEQPLPARVESPSGSPVAHEPETGNTEAVAVARPSLPLDSNVLVPHVSTRGRTLTNRAMLTLALLIVASALAYGWSAYTRAMEPVRQFWAPMLADPKPLLLSIGSNAVYRVGDRQIDDYIAQNQAQSGEAGQEGMELFPPFRPEQSFGSTGLYAAPNSFVALGDVAAASEVVQMMTHYGKEFEERFPNDISFAEVREHSTVLIGGANNPTTRDLTRGVPFVRSGRNLIQDREHPGKGWELHASPDAHDTEDYAIITRLAASKDSLPLVSVAGLGQYGTLAATDFLFRPEDVATLRQTLGADWLKRNFQVVLRIKITNFKPTKVVIVDQRTW